MSLDAFVVTVGNESIDGSNAKQNAETSNGRLDQVTLIADT
jgi:hypothetical protein